MRRILLTTLIVSVALLLLMSQVFAIKEGCTVCGFYFIIKNSVNFTFQTLCTVLIFEGLTRMIKLDIFAIKIIVGIVVLSLTTMAILYIWAAAEFIMYYGGFDDLTMQAIRNEIAQEFGGLTPIILILSVFIPLTYELLKRKELKRLLTKAKKS